MKLDELFSLRDPVRLGIVGSRDWPDPKFVVDAITSIVTFYPSIEVIVSGDQPKGVDGIAKAYAKAHSRITYKGYPPAHWLPEEDPNYKKYHVSNFFERNTQIAEDVDMLVAFCYQKSKGTLDTYYKAKNRGLDVLLYTEEDLKDLEE